MKHSTSPVRVAARVAFRAANILLVFLAGNFVGNAQPPDTFELPQSVWTQLSPHPRLFANGARWQALTQQVRQDPVSQRLFSVVRDTAERLLDQPPVDYRDTGAFWHGPMRQAQGRIFALAFTYRITGDDRFLNRARLEMQTLAELPNWYPQHFLDTAEGALGMAIGLDWLHDALPVEHRLSTNNKETLVRGPNELKNIGPNHLPCWEVLFQYFHPRRQLKWLKPEKLVQRNHAVDPRNSKKRYSADRKALSRSVFKPSGRRSSASLPWTVPKLDRSGCSPISMETYSIHQPTLNMIAAAFSSPC